MEITEQVGLAGTAGGQAVQPLHQEGPAFRHKQVAEGPGGYWECLKMETPPPLWATACPLLKGRCSAKHQVSSPFTQHYTFTLHFPELRHVCLRQGKKKKRWYMGEQGDLSLK